MRGAEGKSDKPGQPSGLSESKEASTYGNESTGIAASDGKTVPHCCFLRII
jgi:hypothetical protein